ncbi:MAG: alpha/beta fold hydrolase [Bacteroidales bacterium]|nr:alpha/beta fold hydrolase [Bacteroidales bacterium]
MKLAKILYIFLCLFLPSLVSAQIVGIWEGKLPVGKDSLRLVLAVEQRGDSLYAEMDSPDQYAAGIEVNSISFQQDTLRLKSKEVGASFWGRYDREKDAIQGVFRQGGGKLPLTLRRVAERWQLHRPQTPKAPFPYEEEEVQLQFPHATMGNIPIRGTLTYPTRKHEFNGKLLILVSGSGWQDRDESIMGHKPFAVIADYLTRKGYAVFRYDDFPVAQYAKCTTLDFADATSFVVNYFKLYNEHFKQAKLGIVGHSEGGTIAVMVAAQNKNVDFIVSMAGMMVSAKQTLLYQVEAINKMDTTISSSELSESIRISEILYEHIEQAKSSKEAVDRCGKLLREYSASMTDEQRKRLKMTQQDIFATLRNIGSPWFYELFRLNQPKYLKKVKCPVLALNGKKDLQVEWESNFAVLEQNLPKKTSFTTHAYEQLNHLFQPCTTGSPSEYGEIETTISEDVLRDIELWLEER